MDNGLLGIMLLALLSNKKESNDHVNYLSKYTKYFKYGSDE